MWIRLRRKLPIESEWVRVKLNRPQAVLSRVWVVVNRRQY